MTTRGDIIIRNASNVTARLAKGTATYVLTSDGTDVAWAAPGGGGSLTTTVDATLSGNVTMTTGGTFYDGPSGSFVAGTWLIWYKMHFQTVGTASHEFSCKLWDGSTIYDETEQDMESAVTQAGYGLTANGHALVTLGGTTTLKISATDIRNGQIMLRDLDNAGGGSHTATRLTGVKIA